MEQRVTLITLGVGDLDRARRFYEALGWRTGAARATAEAAGARIPRRAAETFWGGYSGVFLDPDGHPWEVAHNPHWTLREDGSIELP